ncbi:MAG: DUF1015 domain-containing protein [Clostridia bacterium]|nr:DUF1015 domain-containing protein [Clostridia bacterium]
MKKTGLHSANILLPKGVDMNAWAVVACDQFTGEPEYWQTLEKQVSGKPTTLDMILPEVYLNDNPDKRIEKVNQNICKYLDSGVFEELSNGFILTIRQTPYVQRRIGLMGAIDLEEYEYSKKSDALIRSTEGTVEERIPPRLKIRKDAAVEFPHVMVLFDDENREITEPLYQNRDKYKKVYDFDLNMDGGHVEGYFIDDVSEVLGKFEKLLDKERLIKKYGKQDNFAFAVGDGNHSLATAKAHWNVVKQSLSESEKQTHPARYALVELVNIYDEGIYFEPIFRFVTGVDKQAFINGLKDIDCGNIRVFDGKTFTEQKGACALADGIKATDKYIADYIALHGGEVDYIHGESNLEKLVKATENAVGIYFEKLDKAELFRYVSEKGAFPRKTFSMGEGIEKRYYLEGRKIK